MNSLHSAQQVINLIVKQSKEKLHENKVVRGMLVPYASSAIKNKKNDTMLHAGIQYDPSGTKFFKKQLEGEQKPQSSVKDSYSFFSVKKCANQKKQNAEVSVPKQQKPKKGSNRHLRLNNSNRQNSSFNDRATKVQTQATKPVNHQQQIIQSPFIKLQQTPQAMPRYLQKQQTILQNLRQLKHQQYTQKQTQRKRQQTSSQMSTQRQQKLTTYLQNHISRPQNQHTYDIEGNLLLFSTQNNRKAIAKQFPPTIRYQVENTQQEAKKRHNKLRARSNMELDKRNKMDLNISSAKGEIFKSSVLKTINISRISFGGQNVDQHQFMKRNDLFNNNHSRQTTSIPFIKVETGSVFKQTATNQWVGNKPQQPAQTQAQSRIIENNLPGNTNIQKRAQSHQGRYRNSFKKYSSKRQSQSYSFVEGFPQNKIYPMTSKNSKKPISIGDSRYSTFYIKRPYTQEVGRIRRENQQLFASMVEDL